MFADEIFRKKLFSNWFLSNKCWNFPWHWVMSEIHLSSYQSVVLDKHCWALKWNRFSAFARCSRENMITTSLRIFPLCWLPLGNVKLVFLLSRRFFTLSKQLKLTTFSFSFTENNQKHSHSITAFSPPTPKPQILLHKTWSLTRSAVISWTMRFKDTTLASSLMVKQVIFFYILNVPRLQNRLKRSSWCFTSLLKAILCVWN